MTCIIAVKDTSNGIVYMGCDSRGSLNGSLSLQLPESRSKLFETSGFIIGVSGRGTIRNIVDKLEIRFAYGGPTPDFNLEDEIAEVIIQKLKYHARKGGYLHIKEGIENIDGSMLIAFKDQLCLINGDFSIVPLDSDFWAIGSGTRIALGSLATSKNMDITPAQRIYTALEITSEYEQSVGPPFVIKHT